MTPWMQPRHLVGAAAGAGRHDEFTGLVGSHAAHAAEAERLATPATSRDSDALERVTDTAMHDTS